jgi:REP element-mobilizing transposase RayT
LRKFRRANKPSHTDSDHQVWQEGFHPKQIIGDSMMIQKIEYIHNNPVKRGFVDFPEDWRYSSARNYFDSEGLIPVTLFEL